METAEGEKMRVYFSYLAECAFRQKYEFQEERDSTT